MSKRVYISRVSSFSYAHCSAEQSVSEKAACFVFNKIIIGGFRIGVSQNIIIQALAQYTEK
ncbi:MAG: hypothetical protein EOP51_24180, partial [Sphingobacteriales bacterium]